ncbi:SufE family protein [Pseudidiomarina taiwanensis]|uniref:SufE family protein n=1 Tax=Pseudidiomarina taiwanensis TaxID=337250 RepID=UPI001300548C|nr:SufE family protein [Pseudidiomarina taiwanensis]
MTDSHSAIQGYGQLTDFDLSALREQVRAQAPALRYLVQRSRELKANPSLQVAAHEVFGCEAQVWVRVTLDQDRVQLECYSESRVVNGLLAVLQDALNGASTEQVLAFQVQNYFTALGLADFISESRRNGLQAVVQAIQAAVRSNLANN